MYKLTTSTIIIRTNEQDSQTYIPADEANSEYAAYLQWLAEGHTPTPADVPPEPTYQEQRAQAYPSIGDQLDALYHAGVFPADMAAKLLEIKTRFPK